MPDENKGDAPSTAQKPESEKPKTPLPTPVASPEPPDFMSDGRAGEFLDFLDRETKKPKK